MQWLEVQGVNYSEIIELVGGPIVRRLVVFLADGMFAYDQLGESALVHPVLGEDGEMPIDVIAWSPTEPERFGSRSASQGSWAWKSS